MCAPPTVHVVTMARCHTPPMNARTKTDGIPTAPVVSGSVSDRPIAWAMRPARSADVEAIAELKAVVMRADLERLGRFDEHRVRQRLRDSFSPRYTSVIEADGAFAGCVTFRPHGRRTLA